MIHATTPLVKLATHGLEPQRLTANKQELPPIVARPPLRERRQVSPQPLPSPPPPLARASQMPPPSAVAANQAKVRSPKADGYYGAAQQQPKWWQNPWLWGGVGAGALGAYGLSRLGRRRDDDDEKEASYKQATLPLTPEQVIANKQNTSAALANLIALSFAGGGLLGVGAHGLGMATRGQLPAKARMPVSPVRLTPKTKKKKEQPKQASDATCGKQECPQLSPQAMKTLAKWPKRPRKPQPPKPQAAEEQKTANEWDPKGRGWIANTLGKPIYDTFMICAAP